MLQDEVRTEAMIKEHNGIYLDFARQRVTDRTMKVKRMDELEKSENREIVAVQFGRAIKTKGESPSHVFWRKDQRHRMSICAPCRDPCTTRSGEFSFFLLLAAFAGDLCRWKECRSRSLGSVGQDQIL